MSERIPVTVLSGFLGAGKTTTLRALLTEDASRCPAVIVNEAGEIGLDGALLTDGADALVELTDGCVCCSVLDDFGDAVRSVLERQPGVLYVETSGLAAPAPVAHALLGPALAPLLRLERVVVVASASQLARQLAADDLCAEQLAFADVVVLSRAQSCDEPTLRQARELVRAHSNAPLLETERGVLVSDSAAGGLLGALTETRRRARLGVSGPAGAHDHTHDDSVRALSFQLDGEVVAERLEPWLAALSLVLGDQLLRVKGVLAVPGVERRMVVQGVLDAFDLELGEPWSDGELRRCELTFIGRGLHGPSLQQAFESCRATAQR